MPDSCAFSLEKYVKNAHTKNAFSRLTNSFWCDIMFKLSEICFGGMTKVPRSKKLEKSLKNLLTKGGDCGIIRFHTLAERLRPLKKVKKLLKTS